MSFEINRDVVRVPFEDSKAFRLQLTSLKMRIYAILNALLSSVYTDESASANVSVQLLAVAEEVAKFRLGISRVLTDMSYQDVRSFLLYQNLGSILGFGPNEELSHGEYRRLLLAVLSVILGGSRIENIQRGIELFTTYKVRAIEIFKILEKFESEARRSALNLIDSLLNVPTDMCHGNLILNSPAVYNEDFLGGVPHSMLFFDVLILDALSPQLVDKGGTVTDLIRIVKPSHTLFLLRNVFSEVFHIGEFVKEDFVKVQLGVYATVSGSALNDPTDLLTQPLGPGTNVFTLTDSPIIGFVPYTEFFV